MPPHATSINITSRYPKRNEMTIAKTAPPTQIAGIYRLSNVNHSPHEGQGKLSPAGMSEGRITVPQTGHVFEYRDIVLLVLLSLKKLT